MASIIKQRKQKIKERENSIRIAQDCNSKQKCNNEKTWKTYDDSPGKRGWPIKSSAITQPKDHVSIEV